MLSFAVGGAVAFTFIVLGGIGIYGCSLATPPQAGFGPGGGGEGARRRVEFFITPDDVVESLDLDSTFTAAGKCVALEFAAVQAPRR